MFISNLVPCDVMFLQCFDTLTILGLPMFKFPIPNLLSLPIFSLQPLNILAILRNGPRFNSFNACQCLFTPTNHDMI